MDHPDNLVQKHYDNYKKTLEALGLKNVVVSPPWVFTGNETCQNVGQSKGYWINTPNPADYNQGVLQAIGRTGRVTYPIFTNSSYGVRPYVTFEKVVLDNKESTNRLFFLI